MGHIVQKQCTKNVIIAKRFLKYQTLESELRQKVKTKQYERRLRKMTTLEIKNEMAEKLQASRLVIAGQMRVASANGLQDVGNLLEGACQELMKAEDLIFTKVEKQQNIIDFFYAPIRRLK